MSTDGAHHTSPLTWAAATDLLCDLAWQGKWDPLPETNVRPLASLTVQALLDAGWEIVKRPAPEQPPVDTHACCKRYAPGPVFTTYRGDPPPEYICPECGGRWIWDDDEAEGGAWYWDPENDRSDVAHRQDGGS